jgi:hypothetical protein
MADVLARLPHLTVHLVEIPGRWWVADPVSLTCWVHKTASAAERDAWTAEAAAAILAAHKGAPVPRGGPRLRSVPRS